MNKTVSDNEAKLQHSIYRLNLAELKIDFTGDVKSQLEHLFVKKRAKKHSKKGKIDSAAEVDQKFTGYVSCDLKSDIDKKGYDSIFLYKEETRPMDEMNNFITSITGKDLHFKEKTQYSTLLILWKKKNIYAITTGAARFTISEYIEHHFGLKVMSKFKDKIRVRSKSTNPLYGNVHEEEQKLATSVPISYVVSSNSLLSKITGHISQDSEIIKCLELPAKSRGKNNVQIFARDHIRISPKFSFDKLLDLLDAINSHKCKEDTINMIVQKEVNACNRLAERIHDYIRKNGNSNNEQIYIYPQDDADFEVSPKWKISFDDDDSLEVDRGNIVEICKKCIERFFNNVGSVENIEKILSNASIEFGEDKKHKMIDVLNGEVEYKDETYSIVYGKMYSFASDLKGRIESELGMRLNNSVSDDRVWDFMKKNTFGESEEQIIMDICKRKDMDGAYPLHKITRIKKDRKELYKAEFADILINTTNKVYIVHVKCAFNNNMRHLQKQMELSYSMWNEMRTNKRSTEFNALWGAIKEQAEKPANVETYSGNVAIGCKKLIELGEDGFRRLLCGNHKIVYVALIGVNKDLTCYKSNDEFKVFLESRSLTAKLCLERLISFFNDKAVSVLAIPFQM